MANNWTWVCFEHRRSTRQPGNHDARHRPGCPDCGEPMIQLQPRGTGVPRRADVQGWNDRERKHRVFVEANYGRNAEARRMVHAD